MSNSSVAERDFFAYTLDHYESLKALLKHFNLENKKNYEFYENNEIDVYTPRVIIYCEDQDCMLRVYYNSLKKRFHIDVCVDYFSTEPYFTEFRFFRNSYVYQNLREIICVWTRLNIKYKNLKNCDNILNEYIWYQEKNIDYVLNMIEVGSRFRNQCLWHRLLFEVRKKIYETVVKAFCGGHLLECEAFAKRLFP